MALVAGLVGALLPAAARAEGRSEVVVWVTSEDDRLLLERIRGQSSDLPLELRAVEAEAAPSAAPVAPEGTHPKAFVWFTRPDPNVEHVILHVMPADGTRTQVRDVGDGSPSRAGSLASATLEAAALVVREVLRDLTASDTSAVEAPLLAKTAALPAAPLPATSPQAPAGKATSSRARTAFQARVAWELVLDGVSMGRRQGPTYFLGATLRGFEVAAFGSSSLEATESDAHGTIQLRRQAFGVRAGKGWEATEHWCWRAGLRGGALLYDRSAGELAPDVQANADQVSVSALVGAELAVDWAPGRGPLAFTFVLGLDWVPAAPRIGYVVEGVFEPSFELWHLQPLVAIGLDFLGERRP